MAGDVEKLLQCPYVPSHRVSEGTRFQTHLKRCRKDLLQNKTSPWHEKAKNMAICSFNSTHHVPKDKVSQILRDFSLFCWTFIPLSRFR